MQFYTVEALGEHRHLTPEGFLVCRDVPIARTGTQIYGPGETPIETGDAGFVQIERDIDEVFRPETVASLEGKPIVVEHPIGDDGMRCDIDSDNWRDFVVGHVLHPRQGEIDGIPALIADLLVWDKNAIAQINDGKREVSCGYDADYQDLGPGHGRQINIVHNHLALVDAGRCGPLCSIGDADYRRLVPPPEERECPMATSSPSAWERLRNVFRSAEEAIAELEGGGGDNRNGEQHVHVHVGDSSSSPPRRRTRDQEVPAATETVTAENPPLVEQVDQPPAEGSVAGVVARHDDELEELWEANEMERSAIESLMGAGDSAMPKPAFRDAWPHRDARRKRMGINRDQAAPNPLPEAHPTGGTGQSEFEMEAPPGTLDHVRRATDSAWMQPSWDETISWAEVVAPGIRLPAFDARARPAQSFNTLCAFRVRALEAAHATPDGRELIDGLVLDFNPKRMSCRDAKQLLRQAAFVKGRLNSAPSGGLALRPTVDTMGTQLGGAIPVGRSLADYQKEIDAHYRGQRG